LKVLVLDNYDSFTFNLVQYLGEIGVAAVVARNDAVEIDDIERSEPDAVVISPGPGAPHDAGISIELVQWCEAEAVPLLGVCLGHQAIAAAFGASVTRAPKIMHGKTSAIRHRGEGVFAGLPDPFEAMRYHSLAVDREELPGALAVHAWTDDGVVMGLRHESARIEGVQFHPESILTPAGMKLLENFVALA
jgi:anthranilate synthase/aminodeoxychorismate synthase-like glutamine amidotransferase